MVTELLLGLSLLGSLLQRKRIIFQVPWVTCTLPISCLVVETSQTSQGWAGTLMLDHRSRHCTISCVGRLGSLKGVELAYPSTVPVPCRHLLKVFGIRPSSLADAE